MLAGRRIGRTRNLADALGRRRIRAIGRRSSAGTRIASTTATLATATETATATTRTGTAATAGRTARTCIAARPAIFIPLPTAADDHQNKNARALAEAGAAEVLPQSSTTGEALADRIATLLADRALLARMATAMQALARPHAARDIADRLEGLSGKK